MTTILLVEDAADLAQVIVRELKTAGYQTVHAADGVAALKLHARHHPDLVILDWMLPKLDGLEVLRQIRQTSAIPVLMLTARDEEADRVIGLEVGADDYVTKPFSLRELLSRIRAQLRRAFGEFSSADADILHAGDLVIDRGRGQVRRGGETINLTPTEFRLLVYLARHPGQAFSRAQIIDAVWGYAPDVESERAVNVHIRRLREKVELDPSRPTLILTVPGIGYRLVG